jgi:hypothetical protein
MGPLSSVSSISFTGLPFTSGGVEARMHGGAFLYQRHTQPGTSENQRQGETEEENCDY